MIFEIRWTSFLEWIQRCSDIAIIQFLRFFFYSCHRNHLNWLEHNLICKYTLTEPRLMHTHTHTRKYARLRNKTLGVWPSSLTRANFMQWIIQSFDTILWIRCKLVSALALLAYKLKRATLRFHRLLHIQMKCKLCLTQTLKWSSTIRIFPL